MFFRLFTYFLGFLSIFFQPNNFSRPLAPLTPAAYVLIGASGVSLGLASQKTLIENPREILIFLVVVTFVEENTRTLIQQYTGSSLLSALFTGVFYTLAQPDFSLRIFLSFSLIGLVMANTYPSLSVIQAYILRLILFVSNFGFV